MAVVPELWKKPAVRPPVARCPHNCSNLCASHTPSYRRPLSAHVSRIAASSIPHYCCAVRPLHSSSLPVTPSASATYLSPLALTCRPLWVRQPTLHLRATLQHKQAKGYLRGPASWHRLSNSHTSRDRHSSPGTAHQTRDLFILTARVGLLKLVMGSQNPSRKVTSRSAGSSTSTSPTCTNSNL